MSVGNKYATKAQGAKFDTKNEMFQLNLVIDFIINVNVFEPIVIVNKVFNFS